MTGSKKKLAKPSYVTTAVVLVLILAGTVLLQYSIDDTRATSTGWEESSPFETARSFLNVLGGVRETLAAYFWSKTDVLFHQYFKGVAFEEEPIFPYYWMITKLDPHFVMAYYFASWMLCRLGRTEEGFELAIEGLRNNPDSSTLQQNLADIYFFFKKDPEKARYHLVRAIQLTDDQEQKEVLENFLNIVDDVIAGDKSIPEVTPMEMTLPHEHHHHEPGEYCPECERTH